MSLYRLAFLLIPLAAATCVGVFLVHAFAAVQMGVGQ
jgi:hypothetical protein